MAHAQRSKVCILAALFFLCAVNLWWFLACGPHVAESPARIILGAAFLFLTPGLIWGEVLHFRARHPWETVAIAFSLSLLIELILLPIPFFFHATIEFWLGSLFVTTLLGFGILALSNARERTWPFLMPVMRPPQAGVLSWSILLIPFVMATWAYAAGEDLFDVEGEKMLHLMFVRYYHDMPLSLLDLGVRPGVAPPNLVNLWEFLIAAWARLVHLDPLLVFFRARCVIPVLGLAGLYFLLRMIFVSRRKVEVVFFGILLMCLSQFVLNSPTLRWVSSTDSTRGVFAFMGTVHHADPAADILLALGCGLALQMVRRPSWRHGGILFAILAASFLWHPREFLQLSLYLGIFGVTIASLAALRTWSMIRNWGMTTILLFSAAVAFLILSTSLISKESHAYDEMKIKRAALQYAALPQNMLGVRNLFNAPYTLMLSSYTDRENVLSWDNVDANSIQPSWQLDCWLMLSGLAIVVLGFFGRRADRSLAMYYFWLWFLALGWNFSMLVTVALTYSEFFMVTPRLLYLFAYIVIADSLVTLSHRLDALKLVQRAGRLATTAISRHLTLSAAALSCGLMLFLWQHRGSPGARPLSFVLTGLIWTAVAWMLIQRRERSDAPRRSSNLAQGLLILLFFAPFLADRFYQAIHHDRLVVRAQPEWFQDENPFGLSRDFLVWLRELPRGQIFLVAPDGLDCLHAYAPHYETILPVTTLLIDMEERRQIETGEHPILMKCYSPGHVRYARYSTYSVSHERALTWLDKQGVGYLLLNRSYYDNYLRDYVAANPRCFEVVFHNPRNRELVVRYVPRP